MRNRAYCEGKENSLPRLLQAAGLHLHLLAAAVVGDVADGPIALGTIDLH